MSLYNVVNFAIPRLWMRKTLNAASSSGLTKQEHRQWHQQATVEASMHVLKMTKGCSAVVVVISLEQFHNLRIFYDIHQCVQCYVSCTLCSPSYIGYCLVHRSGYSILPCCRRRHCRVAPTNCKTNCMWNEFIEFLGIPITGPISRTTTILPVTAICIEHNGHFLKSAF